MSKNNRNVKPTQQAATEQKNPPILYGSSVLPAIIELHGGLTASLGDVVRESHAASGLSMDEWNALPEAEREARLAETVAGMAAQAAAGEPPAGQAATPLQGQGPEGSKAAARVALRGPSAGSVSVAGTAYEVDEDGCVEVDPAHVADLAAHGFVQA